MELLTISVQIDRWLAGPGQCLDAFHPTRSTSELDCDCIPRFDTLRPRRHLCARHARELSTLGWLAPGNKRDSPFSSISASAHQITFFFFRSSGLKSHTHSHQKSFLSALPSAPRCKTNKKKRYKIDCCLCAKDSIHDKLRLCL
jgi:hypothetical protein